MSTMDINTIRQLPTRLALNAEYREKVRAYAEQEACPLARRSLLALLGRVA